LISINLLPSDYQPIGEGDLLEKETIFEKKDRALHRGMDPYRFFGEIHPTPNSCFANEGFYN
jgi:hypothetical protein